MARKRIIIVENNRSLADRIVSRLQQDGHTVEVARTAEEGFGLIRASGADLILADMAMVGGSGAQLAEAVHLDPSTTVYPLIALMPHEAASQKVLGLPAGVEDFLIKPFGMPELSARVAAVLRRSGERNTAATRTMQIGPLYVDQQRHDVYLQGKPLVLTLTEFRILSALVSAGGRVLSRNQLIDQAIGADALVTDRTIDVHLTSLRRKLGQARTLLKTVRGVGYRLLLDEE